MNSTLKTRGITAVVFIAVMIIGVFLSPYSFIALMCAIIGGCIWEFLSITCEKSLLRMFICIASGISIALLFAFGKLQGLPENFIFHSVFVLVLMTIILCVHELSTSSTIPFQNISFSVFSVLFYAIFIGSIFFIAFDNGAYNAWKVFGLIVLTWTNDTMAYVVGSQIGKNKMFSRISPNKTWEGTIGGILFTLLLAYLFYTFLGIFTLPVWLMLGLIIGVFGTLGDLVESMLKRSLSVKDSGSLLPGHGGLLDRFDSFTLHMPLCVYLIKLCTTF